MSRLVLGLTLGSLLLSACRADRPSSEDEAEIRAVLDRQKDAWNRGDLEAFMQGYHQRPDIVFTSGAKIRRGWNETLTSYQKRYGDEGEMGHLEFSEVELSPVGADGAIALGRFTLTETPQAGTGIFSLVFAREQGKWAIVHDHTSAETPPAETPAKK